MSGGMKGVCYVCQCACRRLLPMPTLPDCPLSSPLTWQGRPLTLQSLPLAPGEGT